ncbi:MAG: PKD domain-containing protein [Methylacidiphilales bacterium]|nr:PKD domain-containing protein [Candidatus Methylacidiphilales bacterium]
MTATWVCLLLFGPMAWAQTPPSPPSPTSTTAPTPAPVPEWAISSAPARFVVDQEGPDKPAPVSWVTLCVPDLDWLTLPIRVFADNGTAAGCDLLWTAPGEPATLLFDSSSGAKRYKIYFGSNWPALHLDNPKSGVILESRAGDGKPMYDLTGMLQAWNHSTTVYGRGIVGSIFEGGHRFGPQANIFEHFQGWFDVAAPEHLQLAAISNDASFVLIDGKEVVEWPGLHGFHEGLQGQHQGAVDLTPGVHLLECYNAYAPDPNPDRHHPLLCCLAAMGGALPQWTMLMPSAGFFRPISHAHVVDYQLESSTPGTEAGARAPAYAIEWLFNGQSVIGPDVPDIGLISTQLTCRPQPTGTATWTFDDGTTAQGAVVQHLFPRPGMRTVRLSATDGTKDLGSVVRTISIHPNWTQLTTYPPQLTPAHLTDLMNRDPATFSASDLAGCVAVFGVFKNSDGLLKILPAVCAGMKGMNDADLPYVKTAGVYLANEDLLHFSEAGQLLRALVDRCPTDAPSPQLITIGSEARLALAQLTLKTSDHADEVKMLLDGVDVQALTGDEHRAFDILRADLALATGDVAGAKKQYQNLTGEPSGPDARSSVRRTARIGQARAFLDRKDFEATENALTEVAWQAPIEKMSPDWALTRLRLYQEQGLPGAAYLWATRLLPVITESGRSELLFRLIDLAFTQGHDDVAKKALAELLQKHPYSEEAAKAKEKWPGKG